MPETRASLVRRGRDALDAVDCVARASELGTEPLCVELMVSRGIVDKAAQVRTLHPRLANLRPPADMAGFDAAVDVVLAAVRRGARVGVFGDYDVDGVTTATILTKTLEAFGLDVVGRVASREDGYGLTPAVARRMSDAGISTLLIGDCGTSDHESLEWLARHDIETIVIDHHQVPDRMPRASALINPHRSDCGFPFKGLCSAGVAFYLAAALRTQARKRGMVDAAFEPRSLLDLAALATVCDMVPLVAENRVLVHHGLQVLTKSPRPGLGALIAQCGMQAGRGVDEEHLGFQLGPRLNAAGRLGSAGPAFELLRSNVASEARPLAERLESLNSQRRQLQQTVVTQAQARLDADPDLASRAGIVVADPGWAHGVVGIAAAGLADSYRRPVAVVAIDEANGVARGSVRSFGDIDVRRVLVACGEHLDRFGGHRAAAGLSLSPGKLRAFGRAFAHAVAEQQAENPAQLPEAFHDGEIGVHEVSPELLSSVQRLGPYGMGFPAPRFLLRQARVSQKRIIKGRHVALTFESAGKRLDAIWFGSTADGIDVGMEVCGLGVPIYDSYRRRVQLRINDLWRE